MVYKFITCPQSHFEYSVLVSELQPKSGMAAPPPKLSGYTAVPARMVAIPGTEYVLLTPRPSGPEAGQVRARRGRPKGKTVPCSCPSCKIAGGGDRHSCHHEGCGKTFTKTSHLRDHLRYEAVQQIQFLFQCLQVAHWFSSLSLQHTRLWSKLRQEWMPDASLS